MDPQARPPAISRALSYAITLLFLGTIFAPLTLSFWTLTTATAAKAADGALVPPPAWPSNFQEAKKWPGAFKWYFKNEFGLRRSLIHAYGLLNVRLLKSSSNPDVLLGKQGWLFLASEQVLDFHRGADPFTPSELEGWTDALRERQAWLARQDIEYLVVITPDKHTIYPEYLPASVAPGRGPTRMDQLKEAVSQKVPNLHFLDLRATLSALKEKQLLYFKTDTHWNALGGKYAADEVSRLLDIPHVPGQLTMTPGDVKGGDLARMLGLTTDFDDVYPWAKSWKSPLLDESGSALTWTLQDVAIRRRVVAINPQGKGVALIFRDSFGEAMIPWLSSSFQKTIWIWTYDFDADAVKAENPDFVITQFVERKLMSIDVPHFPQTP